MRGEDRIMEITKAVGGNRYINLPGGKNLYSEKIFKENGIALEFLDPNLKLNGLLDNSFSIIDCVANHGFRNLEKWFCGKSMI